MIPKLICCVSFSLGVVIQMSIKIVADSTIDLPEVISKMHDMHIGEMALQLIQTSTGALDRLGVFGSLCITSY